MVVRIYETDCDWDYQRDSRLKMRGSLSFGNCPHPLAPIVVFRPFLAIFLTTTSLDDVVKELPLNLRVSCLKCSPPLTLFFETLTKPWKQKTVCLEELFSTKTPKMRQSAFPKSTFFSKYSTIIHWYREKLSHFYYHALSYFIIFFILHFSSQQC